MTQKMKPRLGRGLSALIGQPVAVTVPESVTGAEPPESGNRAPSKPERELPVSTMQSDAGRVHTVPVAMVRPNRHQPRQSFNDATLAQLAESIRSAGLMQPVLVRRDERGARAGAGGFELVAGERRWRAAQLAGLLEIPAIIVELSDQDAAEWALVENLQREDLNPIDRATAFRGLSERFGLTQAQIAQRVGIDRSSVANTVRLLELEGEIREMVAQGALSMGHAKALLSGPAGEARARAARLIVRDGWSVRETEQWVSRATQPAESSARPESNAQSPQIADLEKQLGDHLGTRVRLKRGRSSKKGRLVIDFYSEDHFEGLMSKMGFRLNS